MKKIIFIFVFILILFVNKCNADILPFYIDQIPNDAIGLFQTSKQLRLMSEPESNSDIVKLIDLNYKPEDMPDNMFAVLLNAKQLGFLYVIDIADEGWYKVIYNKKTGAKAWINSEDNFQFLNWYNFYNMYGRKYGLRFLKDAPNDLKILKSQPEENAQNISSMNLIKKIKLTVIKGNWALVSVFDIDKIPKTGYMKWRDDNGKIYVFPDIK